jgi:hypothetical protein
MSATASRFLALSLLLAAASPSVAEPQDETLDCVAAGEQLRRRPGSPAPSREYCTRAGVPPADWHGLAGFAALPDRWRIVSSLGYAGRWWDPYNGNNVLKADRPAFGDDWFFSLNLVSDTTLEDRSLPTPVAVATAPNPGTLDVLGRPDQNAFTQNLLAEIVLYRGDTVFKPPDYEFRFIPVFNYTRVEAEEAGFLRVDTTASTTRTDNFVAIQGLFVDKHLRNVSERYDFDSIRVGIQPITADFRGFLFQDAPFGVRLFGTRNNNLWQYNLAWFRRIEKDTNSGLNDVSRSLRDDDVFLFNVYRQDFPVLGFTSQLALVVNINDETDEVFVDDNGFKTRPAALGMQTSREYDVTYLGYNGDGHIGPWNLSMSAYYAFGSEAPAVFAGLESDISAGFFAAELSRDFDWIRIRGSVVYGSGDDDPYDDRSTGYDAIFENPLIAGADTSFWIRQVIPLIGGGRVALSGQNGLLNSLRPNKGQGQSNFTNPGLVLAGIGMDLDLTPRLRVSLNANQLWFDDTAVLEAARNQGGIDTEIGQDISLSLIYRPFTSQNVIVRFAAAALLPGDGYEALYGDKTPFSVFANLVLAY